MKSELYKYVPHIFTPYQSKEDLDEGIGHAHSIEDFADWCAKCGENFRDPVHIRGIEDHREYVSEMTTFKN